MKQPIPRPRSIRNPRAHLDLAAGLPGAFEQLFAEATEPHDASCRCPDCGVEPASDDAPDAYDVSREIAALVGAL